MAVPSPSKIDLRKSLKERRDRFVMSIENGAKRAAETTLSDHIVDVVGAVRCVAAYLPIGSEIGTLPLIRALTGAGYVTALPHVASRTDTPRFLVWKPGDVLADGPFGLKQPSGDTPETRPDVILTPLLGFDLALNRIGYGAGHYDRAFAANPDATRIGLAWAVQQCDALPVDIWDVPLHAVATETGWIRR
jgi:5-formyltetrahydrofolate cyclo-ligase